jgi:hypothetical protein
MITKLDEVHSENGQFLSLGLKNKEMNTTKKRSEIRLPDVP